MKLEMLVSEKLGKAISESSNQEIYQALMTVVQDMAEQKESNEGKKKVYYVSAESSWQLNSLILWFSF